MIIYLHGLKSSPASFKARLVAERMQQLGLGDQYVCPQLPASPRAAAELVLQLVKDVAPQDLSVIGSSLGGFYATWLAEKLGCRAVLVNPATRAPKDMEKYVGVSTQFHTSEPFEFKREYIAELDELAVDSITRPERYFLLAATGDEVLDWRLMVEHFPGAKQIVIEGSDHGLSEFAEYVDEVLEFCGVRPSGIRPSGVRTVQGND